MPESGNGCLLWAVLGLAPGFEPRYAAPLLLSCYGAAGVFIALAEAFLLALVLSTAVERLWRLLLALSGKYPVLQRLVERVYRARRKASGLVEKYEALGLAVFVAAPLPVTGIYTGAAVAMLLGLPRRATFTALAAGGAASVLITSLVAGLTQKIL